MDEALVKTIGDESRIRHVDAEGRIIVETSSGDIPYQLKPLGQLWGTGHGTDIDPEDEIYVPLFLRLEEDILEWNADHPTTSDGHVLLALKELTLSPENPRDAMAQYLQLGLRLTLSLNNYSRQELKLALRRLIKSVELHSSMGGVRGYIQFIQDQFGGR